MDGMRWANDSGTGEESADSEPIPAGGSKAGIDSNRAHRCDAGCTLDVAVSLDQGSGRVTRAARQPRGHGPADWLGRPAGQPLRAAGKLSDAGFDGADVVEGVGTRQPVTYRRGEGDGVRSSRVGGMRGAGSGGRRGSERPV